MNFMQNTCRIDFHIFLYCCETILGCDVLQQALENNSVQTILVNKLCKLLEAWVCDLLKYEVLRSLESITKN